jgi:hypothetical protein
MSERLFSRGQRVKVTDHRHMLFLSTGYIVYCINDLVSLPENEPNRYMVWFPKFTSLDMHAMNLAETEIADDETIMSEGAPGCAISARAVM